MTEGMVATDQQNVAARIRARRMKLFISPNCVCTFSECAMFPLQVLGIYPFQPLRHTYVGITGFFDQVFISISTSIEALQEYRAIAWSTMKATRRTVAIKLSAS